MLERALTLSTLDMLLSCSPSTRPATSQVSKEGAVVGRLALSLRSATQRCLVGRHPDCDVHLEHLSVSRHHAELTLDYAGHLVLTDLGAGRRAEEVSDDALRMLHVLGVPITSNVTHKNTCKFPMSIHLRRPRQPAMRVHAARGAMDAAFRRQHGFRIAY